VWVGAKQRLFRYRLQVWYKCLSQQVVRYRGVRFQEFCVVLLDWFVDRPKDRQDRRSKLLRCQLGESDLISFVVGNKPVLEYDRYVTGVFCSWFKLGGISVTSDFPVAHARDTV